MVLFPLKLGKRDRTKLKETSSSWAPLSCLPPPLEYGGVSFSGGILWLGWRLWSRASGPPTRAPFWVPKWLPISFGPNFRSQFILLGAQNRTPTMSEVYSESPLSLATQNAAIDLLSTQRGPNGR
jgi:hypothetical protein